MVRSTLTPLLDHIEAVVRENAVRSIARHMDPPTRERLGRMAILDTSPTVRAAAEEALETSN